MARVFTITPGLENMGALKTGGQGSVYKGRRIGEIITAIKILPTPVYSESAADENYTSFENEVAKLKKVNEVPNPNVVKILSSGISDTGNFPFIEMEYIEGPDLEELLLPPHESIFTLSETLKVAEQLANAMAHCHRMSVRHGDIKSNNVKFNTASGNYVLLDFGLAIMSDEQRRSSYRHTGAIEFMAPEQNTGQMLLQTDVYSFGIIIFQLLTGEVPFALKGQGESARNDIRLAHMVLPVPDILEMRRAALPATWSNKKKDQEMELPGWLLSMIYKCLEKKPERRFDNGNELYNYLVQNLIFQPGNTLQTIQSISTEQAKKDVLKRHEELKKQLDEHRQKLLSREDELLTLKKLLQKKNERPLYNSARLVDTSQQTVSKKRVSVLFFIALSLLTCVLAAFVMLPGFRNKLFASNNKATLIQKQENQSSLSEVDLSSSKTNPQENNTVESQTPNAPVLENSTVEKTAEQNVDENTDQENTEKEQKKTLQEPEETRLEKKPIQKQAETNDDAVEETNTSKQANDNSSTNDNVPAQNDKPAQENTDVKSPAANGVSKKYLVVAKAYFYNEPEENTRRNESISQFENAVVQALNERYGFVYVVITNPQGQVFKGWLRKRDLKLYSIE